MKKKRTPKKSATKQKGHGYRVRGNLMGCYKTNEVRAMDIPLAEDFIRKHMDPSTGSFYGKELGEEYVIAWAKNNLPKSTFKGLSDSQILRISPVSRWKQIAAWLASLIPHDTDALLFEKAILEEEINSSIITDQDEYAAIKERIISKQKDIIHPKNKNKTAIIETHIIELKKSIKELEQPAGLDAEIKRISEKLKVKYSDSLGKKLSELKKAKKVKLSRIQEIEKELSEMEPNASTSDIPGHVPLAGSDLSDQMAKIKFRKAHWELLIEQGVFAKVGNPIQITKLGREWLESIAIKGADRLLEEYFTPFDNKKSQGYSVDEIEFPNDSHWKILTSETIVNITLEWLKDRNSLENFILFLIRSYRDLKASDHGLKVGTALLLQQNDFKSEWDRFNRLAVATGKKISEDKASRLKAAIRHPK